MEEQKGNNKIGGDEETKLEEGNVWDDWKEKKDEEGEEKTETEEEKKEDNEEKEKEKEEEVKDDFDDVFDEELDDDFDDEEDKIWEKKKQNYVAAIIILVGLFVGGLFVDTVQLIKGEGVSLKKLEGADVFSAGGKTWVGNSDPIVEMTVLSDKDCKDCQVEPVIDAIKKTALPTMIAKKVELNSEEGKKLVEKFGLKAIPAFIFNDKIKDTEFYGEAKQVMTEKDGSFLIDNAMAGIPNGKYITLPEFASKAAILGNENATLPIVIFGDFQCPFSKQFADTFTKVFEKYKDKVKVSFHQYPLRSIHVQAYNAALASLCANDGGKFWEMYNNLFATQKDWARDTADKTPFNVNAATVGLNVEEFKKCMADEKYKGAIEEDEKVTVEFALSGTPAVFIGNEFINGAVTEEKLTQVIDSALGTNKK